MKVPCQVFTFRELIIQKRQFGGKQGFVDTFSYFRGEMEEVVASVFDLMGKTADPNLEDEFLKHRVDCMFHVSEKLLNY